MCTVSLSCVYGNDVALQPLLQSVPHICPMGILIRVSCSTTYVVRYSSVKFRLNLHCRIHLHLNLNRRLEVAAVFCWKTDLGRPWLTYQKWGEEERRGEALHRANRQVVSRKNSTQRARQQMLRIVAPFCTVKVYTNSVTSTTNAGGHGNVVGSQE